MPCSDGRDDYGDLQKTYAKLDQRTQHLCAILRIVETVDTGAEVISSIHGLGDWWHRHKEYDKAREAGMVVPEP